ncbi:MAG TPA: prepilin-type N-terminal cleavage/methylation domain-containing protein [Candidatus Caccocola faecipullorum]|nr:prepilin-type N-terminal cleavage/methylation domain-containing protein [Candidatus Caccocola faecipullorum]
MKRRSGRRGFTLVELLCVSAALCILAGAAALAFGEADERRIVREEAEELRSWLSSRMAQAAREGADFKLYPVDDNARHYELMLEWDGGSRDMEHETYLPERADIGLTKTAREYKFDGEWFTLTPAASFIIRSRKDFSIRLFVTVSGSGYAGVYETLEEQ